VRLLRTRVRAQLLCCLHRLALTHKLLDFTRHLQPTVLFYEHADRRMS